MCRLLWCAVFALALLTTGCASLPSLEGRTATSAIVDTFDTRLARAVAPGVAANPGKTGIHALAAPHDAIAARALLAAAAEKSLDVQYYIWHGDEVGYLLFEAVWQAAERGVRVRLLLDDLNTKGLDPVIAAFIAHRNIEVRLYNPVLQRGARALNFLTDFTRVNRRMHNKSLTADNQVSVVGGRNIGNEYFAAGAGVGFVDLDVIVVGAAVQEVSKQFDLYWNSPSAYPAANFVTPAPGADADLESRFSAMRAAPESVRYIEDVRKTPLIRNLLDRNLPLEWTAAQVLYDDPAKTLDTTARTDVLLFPELVRTVGRPDKMLDLVSPYFVSGVEGTAALGALVKRGVKVRVLTNSLAASDVKAVHAGYMKRRRDLLLSGVQLHEFKPNPGQAERDGNTGYGGSSSGSLHAKTFAVDGDRIFVGSFNFDPRSARLNTEMGLVIQSPALARRLAAYFDAELPMAAYEVRLTTDGSDIEWIEQTGSGVKRYDVDPGTSWLLRRQVDLLSILPIEWLL